MSAPAFSTPPALALAYLVVEVARPAAWDRFCADVLGLPAPARDPDGRLAWQLDDRARRLVAEPGPRDDLAALGFACPDDASLDALLARVAAAGRPALPAPEALRAARAVARLHRTTDPDGNVVELATGLEAAARPFESDAFPDGFRIGDEGFGHVALVTHDLSSMERFYADALGFAVTERLETKVGPLEVRGTFMHCNRRHHTLALFDVPLARRLHHFMLEAPTLRDIGVAHERARRLRVPMSLGLGQHPSPDDTFSFYGATPSGFDFEIGAGARTIEPAGWTELRATRTSAWGHRPHLRLRLKMAGGLLRQRLGRGRGRAAAGAAR